MKKSLLFLFCIPFLGIAQNSHTINTAGNTFLPSSLTITVGDTVTFNNTGGSHNVNGTQGIFPNNPQSFGNSVASAPWSFQWVFTMPGTYDYQCDPHAGIGMIGVIVVNIITTSDLLITEITDPQNSSTAGRYVEIYNSGTQDIDLSSGYALVRWTNANTSPQSSVGLTGIIPAGGFYVVCNSGTKFLSTYGVPASQNIGTGGPADSNGDDNIALLAPDSTIIDMFGLAGEDGSGTGHEFEDGRAERACGTSSSSTWLVGDWNIDNDSGGGDGPQFAPADFDPFAWICITTNVSGCTDTSAVNYSANATTDDGSCCFVSGCTDSLAFNYDATVCYDDGSCIVLELGCIDILAMNFDSTANTNNGSCIYLNDKVDLFFSEYGEGTSNNKYLEIYNTTANPVNLSSYALTRVSNAPTTTGVYEYWVDFDSGAVILANDVYVIAHPSADSILLAQADMTYSVLSNGDDGFALVYGEEPAIPIASGNQYIILDMLGDFLGDPGSGWDVAGITEATKDHTLVRKCSITHGDTNWIASAGVDSLTSQWLVYPQDYWTDIGQHSDFCGCTDPLACNYDSLANIDNGSCAYDAIWQQAEAICNGDSVMVGSSVYYLSGTYTDSLSTIYGCDSTVYTTLTVNNATDFQQSIILCEGDSLVVGSNTYYNTGNYSDTLTTISGCDSIILSDLGFHQQIPLIIQSEPNPPEICLGDTILLEASAGFISYAWTNGMTGQIIYDNPTEDTWYMVEAVDTNGCVASEDVNVYVDSCITGINEISVNIDLKVYPNPASDKVNILLSTKTNEMQFVEVINTLGKIVNEHIIYSNFPLTIDVAVFTAGTYVILLKDNKGRTILTERLIVD